MIAKLTIFFFLFTGSVYARKTKKSSNSKINYKYKKYEKFDFDDLDVKLKKGAPLDLTLAPGFKRDFSDKIPEKRNFNKEMIRDFSSLH